jgi:hypothetical protein
MSDSGNIAHDKYVSASTEAERAFQDTVCSGPGVSALGVDYKMAQSFSQEVRGTHWKVAGNVVMHENGLVPHVLMPSPFVCSFWLFCRSQLSYIPTL